MRHSIALATTAMDCAPELRLASLEVMFQAVERVRERLMRSTSALEGAHLNHAVIGANAVAYWVGLKDEGSIRNTPNVDILLDREDWNVARPALERVGFVFATPIFRPAVFLDGADGKVRQAVRLWFAGDTLSLTSEPLPPVTDALLVRPYRIVTLSRLIRMKLSAWRTIDRVHLQDMTRVGVLDSTWPERFPEPLAERLREILADPDG
ncbi:hypothetical protein VT84_16190 [Gemmata sp. SH-PL17]|nr:hypothetical protein VT84_16190 [Gemmata sp. SH-PL17]